MNVNIILVIDIIKACVVLHNFVRLRDGYLHEESQVIQVYSKMREMYLLDTLGLGQLQLEIILRTILLRMVLCLGNTEICNVQRVKVPRFLDNGTRRW